MTQMTACAETTASPSEKSGVDYSKFDNIVDSDDEKPLEEKDSKPEKPKEKPHCANCMKDIVKGFRCSVCKKVEYCSQKCQREDWQFHKRVCKKAEAPKPKEETKKQETEKREPARPKAEDKVVVEDDEELGDITWYRHREWKPTNEPKKEFKPVQLAGDEAAAAAAAETAKPAAGSAWNSAGTWEDKDVTEMAKSMLRRRLEDVPTLDAAGGSLSILAVESLDGEASKPVVRGVKRHLWDLSVKLKFNFKWMGSDGQLTADGCISINDFTQNTSFEAGCDSLHALVVDVAFKGASKVDASRRPAVEEALGAKVWPPAEGTLMAVVGARLQAFAEEFTLAS
jgi:hypothetical protein